MHAIMTTHRLRWPNGREQSSKQSMQTAGQGRVVAMSCTWIIIEFAHSADPLLLCLARFDRCELRTLVCGTRLALSSRPDKAVCVVM